MKRGPQQQWSHSVAMSLWMWFIDKEGELTVMAINSTDHWETLTEGGDGGHSIFGKDAPLLINRLRKYRPDESALRH